MPKYILTVSWSMETRVEVEAETREKAKGRFETEEILPPNGEYISGTLQVDETEES